MDDHDKTSIVFGGIELTADCIRKIEAVSTNGDYRIEIWKREPAQPVVKGFADYREEKK